MNHKYSHVQWVVQRNLTSEDTSEQIAEACEMIGASCLPLQIIPFSEKLPAFERKPINIPYGSTTFGFLAAKDVSLRDGYFLNDNFNMRVYLKRWGKHMLNHEAVLISLPEIAHDLFPSDKAIFVRPLDDSKSFSGTVMKFSELLTWRDQLLKISNTDKYPIGEVLLSEPCNIAFEWRLWIVNKKVIAATKYRESFRLSKQRGCPQAVVKFAEKRCAEFTPHDVFVMDIGETGGELYIIECGCANSAGFYHADIEVIVNGITEYTAGK